MRIIHTSDWHLGQHFMGKSREPEHRAFLDWLLALISRSRADVLVVAGDIFDTGTPPSYARAMYNDFIVSLQQTGCAVTVILGGNHDSAATLNEARELLACLNTRVVGSITKVPQDHVLVLRDRDGRPGALLCAVPFIRPRDLVTSLADQSGQDKKQALVEAIASFYDQVFSAACDLQETLGGKLPIIATGHLTMVGGSTSESVREIYIGALDAFPAGKFPLADYIALGHLHHGQRVKGADHIRYSGSPIPLSFDEAKQEKQVLQVDFAQEGVPKICPIPIPCFRTLACVQGDLERIEQAIKDLAVPTGERSMWLEVVVATDDYLTDLVTRVQTLIDAQDRPIELLRIRRKPKAHEPGLITASKEKLEELKPREVFLRRLAKEEMDDRQKEGLLDLFKEILSQVEQGELP
ncbi:MAG: exonuclease subunit SbcD [Proteobacteria bacterium]|nr:exonuclease subunit SbcD [Pseudomonadota bacterium]